MGKRGSDARRALVAPSSSPNPDYRSLGEAASPPSQRETRSDPRPRGGHFGRPLRPPCSASSVALGMTARPGPGVGKRLLTVQRPAPLTLVSPMQANPIFLVLVKKKPSRSSPRFNFPTGLAKQPQEPAAGFQRTPFTLRGVACRGGALRGRAGRREGGAPRWPGV
ncbi:hypothetical protein P7K49_015062, partial [Saguinus oedipus]